MSSYKNFFAKTLGLKVERPLTQACADFYLLEMLESKGDKTGKAFLSKYESELASEFASYFEYACVTELNYIQDECGVSYTYHDDYCGCGCGSLCCECIECDCAGEDCYCGDSYSNSSRETYVPPTIRKWQAIRHTGNYSMSYGTWYAWEKIREEEGLVPLKEAVDAFKLPGWSSGFGGPLWATIAGLVYDYKRGEVKSRLFIDRCWTLEHNGGCAFNKASYMDYHSLKKVLDIQASGDYVKLHAYSSLEVRKLWTNYHRINDPRLKRSPEWLGVCIEWGNDLEGGYGS